jgi:biopolymer transport protein ExbD
MGKRHAIPAAMSGVQMGLIITPMLDMSFQILSFFIMTYHPSALEGHIDGNLLPPTLRAEKGEKKTEKLEDFPPVDSPPDLEDAVLVILRTTGSDGKKGAVDGAPRQILIKRPVEVRPVPVVEDDLPPREGLKVLTKELKRILKEPGQSGSNIKIEGDGDLKHEHLMNVFDACKMAGYQNISFVAPARERAKE